MLKKVILSLAFTSVFLTSCGENTTVLTQQALQKVQPSQQEIASFAKTIEKNTLDRFVKVNNALYRGSVPDENDMKYLKGLGVKTFISFRGAATRDPEYLQVNEEKTIAEKLKVKFVNIPVPFDTPIPDSMLKQFFKTVEEPKNQPVYVHCLHGRDMTGTMVALYRMRTEGISGKEALKDMEKYGFKQMDYPIFTKQVLTSTPAALKKL